MVEAVLGVDVGTSSTKGVVVSRSGEVLATAVREHEPTRPAEGHVEMDARIWWDEFVSIAREVTADMVAGADASVMIGAVGVSGMGPCVCVADADDEPLRPAILYGVDTRAVDQIAELTRDLGEEAIRTRCGSVLSSQAAGPKILWVRQNEPDAASRMRRLYMPSSWLVNRLTGEYVLDHHSASQCTPMYDTEARGWYAPWAERVAPDLELPPLRWAGEGAGVVTPEAAAQTGLPEGIPVTTGTIDAWAEAVSVGAHEVGDLMLMYGTTMFLINTLDSRMTSSTLWGTVGAFPGTYNLAGGMATSGAITSWLRDLVGGPDYRDLLAEAGDSGVGARGLLMLPYFAGERTPFSDPDARGTVTGLTLEHGRGDLYRAALEATAFGVRHNVEAIREQGGDIRRIVGVGGGTQGGLWTQIVSDVTGLTQVIPTVTVGASYGSAFLAASLDDDVSIRAWNPAQRTVVPRPEARERYDELYRLYRRLHEQTEEVMHALVRSRQATDAG